MRVKIETGEGVSRQLDACHDGLTELAARTEVSAIDWEERRMKTWRARSPPVSRNGEGCGDGGRRKDDERSSGQDALDLH